MRADCVGSICALNMVKAMLRSCPPVMVCASTKRFGHSLHHATAIARPSEPSLKPPNPTEREVFFRAVVA